MKLAHYEDFTMNYSQFDRDRFIATFTEYGVVNFENAFPEEYCDEKLEELISIYQAFGESLNGKPNIEKNGYTCSDASTNSEHLFDKFVGDFPSVFDLRYSSVVNRLFSIIYGDEGNFIVSSNGFTLLPNRHEKELDYCDWPHVDQTKCGLLQHIQGHVVLSNSSTSFCCSPKSHELHKEVLDLYNARGQYGQFLRLDSDKEKLDHIKGRLYEVGGAWQIAVPTKKGSFLLWASSLFHSFLPTRTYKNKQVSSGGWSCALYTCIRPKLDQNNENLRLRVACLREVKHSNHWCSVEMNLSNRKKRRSHQHHVVDSLIENATFVKNNVQSPNVNNPIVRELTGMEIYVKNTAELKSLLHMYLERNEDERKISGQHFIFQVVGVDENNYCRISGETTYK